MKKIKKKTTYYYLFLKHRGEFKKRLRWKSIYFYDRQGKPIKQLFFMVRGRKKLTLFDTKIFKYDALGQLVAEEFYASKGWLKERGVYKYNPISSTKQIKWERYDYWGRVIFRNRYSICYDKSGRIIWKRWTRQGTYAISLYEYDRKNRLIKEKFKTRRKRDCYIREYRYQAKTAHKHTPLRLHISHRRFLIHILYRSSAEYDHMATINSTIIRSAIIESGLFSSSSLLSMKHCGYL